MKVWEHSWWKYSVFPLSPGCQHMFETAHPLGSMQLEGFVSDLWPDLPNNSRNLASPRQAKAEELIGLADLSWPP